MRSYSFPDEEPGHERQENPEKKEIEHRRKLRLKIEIGAGAFQACWY